MADPLPNGANGYRRDDSGRFTKGTCGGPGNPAAAKVHEFRMAVLGAVTPEHVRAIFQKLAKMAYKDGSIPAAKLVLEYTIGRPQEPDLLERLEALEAIAEGMTNHDP